jgi:hypothetical protein
LQSQLNTLIDGDATSAIDTFNEIIAFLSSVEDTESLSNIIASIEQQIADKQDKINDLNSIREGAAKGATAIQSIPEEYATRQYVNDMINHTIFDVLNNPV